MSIHTAKPGSWRWHANQVLAQLYASGRQPTRREIFDAYPFGEREYTPYKVWLEQCRWWADGCPAPAARPRLLAPVSEAQRGLL